MDKKNKVLYLITGLEIGGAENMLLKTLPAMQNEFDIRVCCIKGRGEVSKQLPAAGIPVYFLDLKNYFDFWTVIKFRRIVTQFKPDILITVLIHADLFGRFWGRLFGIKTIICSVRVKLIETKYLPLLVLDGFTNWMVTGYLFNSRTVADLYRKWFFLPTEKVNVIPNGVMTKEYLVKKDNNNNIKKSLRIPSDAKVIGYVAKLRLQKGHKYLISAFHTLLHNYPNLFLILVGGGEEKPNIQSQINSLNLSDRVILLGDRNDIPFLLRIFNIYVHPSLFEGMSNSILEAMASGLPVLASDIPENRELIIHGKTGLLFHNKNPHAIVDSVDRILENPRLGKYLGKMAQKEAIHKYDIKNTINQLSSYLNLIGNN